MSIQDNTRLGEALKHQGISRAEGAADLDWKIAAYDCVIATARAMQTFTADDVFDRIDKTAYTTHENRAFGAIIRNAARDGLCRKTQTFPETRPSTRPQLHRGREQIWDSLIWGSVQAFANPYA